MRKLKLFMLSLIACAGMLGQAQEVEPITDDTAITDVPPPEAPAFPAPAMRGPPELSKRCAALHGDYIVHFHGQVVPFTRQTYTLKLSFLAGSQGLVYKTDFDIWNVTVHLDTDAHINTMKWDWSLSGLTINDCYAQPQQCVESAVTSLRHLMIAKTNQIYPLNENTQRALYCGIERVRHFIREMK